MHTYQWNTIKSDARQADFCLKEVNIDIRKAATIITKSLLSLHKVAQDVGCQVAAHEVGKINGTFALLGNANHRNNFGRSFIMKLKIN